MVKSKVPNCTTSHVTFMHAVINCYSVTLVRRQDGSGGSEVVGGLLSTSSSFVSWIDSIGAAWQ